MPDSYEPERPCETRSAPLGGAMKRRRQPVQRQQPASDRGADANPKPPPGPNRRPNHHQPAGYRRMSTGPSDAKSRPPAGADEHPKPVGWPDSLDQALRGSGRAIPETRHRNRIPHPTRNRRNRRNRRKVSGPPPGRGLRTGSGLTTQPPNTPAPAAPRFSGRASVASCVQDALTSCCAR